MAYNDPGTDKIWGTADDLEYADAKPSYYRCTNHIVTVEYNEFSSNNVRDTLFDADGNEIKYYDAYESGADGVWGTSDDLCNVNLAMNYTVYEPQNSNWNKTQKNYRVGSDELIGTADDIMTSCTILTFDGNIPRKSVMYTNSDATSAIWNLDDSLIDCYLVYNQVSGVYRTTLYSGSGTDAKWFTDDDTVETASGFMDYTFNTNGTYSKLVMYDSTGAIAYMQTYTWKGFN